MNLWRSHGYLAVACLFVLDACSSTAPADQSAVLRNVKGSVGGDGATVAIEIEYRPRPVLR